MEVFTKKKKVLKVTLFRLGSSKFSSEDNLFMYIGSQKDIYKIGIHQYFPSN